MFKIQLPLFLRQIIFSLFIIFHLAVLIILSNSGSYLSRIVPSYFYTYANSIGINGSWFFFSPEPPSPHFYKYKVTYKNEQGLEVKMPNDGFFPPEGGQFVFNNSRRRLLNSIRYVWKAHSHLASSLLGSWICRNHSGGTHIRVESVSRQIPSLEEAVEKMNESIEDLIIDKVELRIDGSCIDFTEGMNEREM